MSYPHWQPIATTSGRPCSVTTCNCSAFVRPPLACALIHPPIHHWFTGMNIVAGLTAHIANPSHRPTTVDSLFVCVTTKRLFTVTTYPPVFHLPSHPSHPSIIGPTCLAFPQTLPCLYCDIFNHIRRRNHPPLRITGRRVLSV
jgi:hypothetical protein